MRTSIPKATKKALRKEVGFGCPVRGCGNPYLEYHHFDPPVRIRPHNEPAGMIALCPQHHRMADGGAYSVEQLKSMKLSYPDSKNVRGNLEWMRNTIMVYSGGNIYINHNQVLRIDGKKVVYFSRDQDGYLLLSINMLSLSGRQRLCLKDNSWDAIGDPVDLRSPPSGKELEVSYDNGDKLSLRFVVFDNAADCIEKYKSKHLGDPRLVTYPLTVLEVDFAIGGTNINVLRANQSRICGLFLAEGECAIVIDNSGYDLK